MTEEEKKARELVEEWGEYATRFCDRKIIEIKEFSKVKIRLAFWQSVREHILKLKNETNVHKK